MNATKFVLFALAIVVGMFIGGALITENLDDIELQCVDTKVINIGG